MKNYRHLNLCFTITLLDFLTAKDQRKRHQTHYLWIINVEQCQAIPKTTNIVGTGN